MSDAWQLSSRAERSRLKAIVRPAVAAPERLAHTNVIRRALRTLTLPGVRHDRPADELTAVQPTSHSHARRELSDALHGFDPQRITNDEIEENIRLRFPSAGCLRLLRRSTNVTFSNDRYIYKVPVTEAALEFAGHETQITQMLPDDPQVDFPRIELSGTSVPILRYRLIPGNTAMEKWHTHRQWIENRRQRILRAPSDFASLLGKAIAILHSCDMPESLRGILEARGREVLAKYRRLLTRQVRLGNVTSDYRTEKVAFLDHLDGAGLVFCHGDINLKNILVPANSEDSGKIGIIDFGKSCLNVREFDFATFRMFLRNYTNGPAFHDEVAESYERHSGYGLDRSLIDKFGALHRAIRDMKKARKSVSPHAA